MNIEGLIARCESAEGLELEFKAAAEALPESLWETVSAFANTAGGWLLLGITQKGPAIRAGGVKNAARVKQDISNLMRNPEKISREVCGPDDLKVETVDGVDVIALHVRAAATKEKPVYIKGNPYRGTFLRRNEGDYLCTKAEVDRMIRDASTESADSAILKGRSRADLDDETFAKYRRRYRQFNPASPWNDYDDDRFLAAIGGYREDPETGMKGLTRAAALMFGKRETLLSLRPRHLIDFRLLPVSANEADVRWEDRIPWEGNLYEAFFQIYPRLVQPLKIPFKLEGPHRLNETASHEALRECLVNALAHTDYAEAGVILVKASPQEFVFRNPGDSRVPEEDLLTKDRSDPRNPVLLKMFRYVSLAEEAGTGLPRVLRTWRRAGLELPSLTSDTKRYEFQITLRLVHLLSHEDRGWLSWCAKNHPAKNQRLPGTEILSQNEQLALVQARKDGSVNNAAIQALTSLHRADVTQLLISLRNRGLLEQESTRRWAAYRLPDLVLQAYHEAETSKENQTELSARSQRILESLRRSGPLKAQQLLDALGEKISLRIMQKELGRLRESGQVTVSGKGRATIYVLSKGR